MKKTFLVLAVLMLAVPVMAGITVTPTQVGTTNVVKLSYARSGTGDVNLPRAFALDVKIDKNLAGNLGSDAASFDPNFYVAPGTFTADGTHVTSWGNRIAVSDHNSMTIEMGSLYATNDSNHPTPPNPSGVLMTFGVPYDCNVTLSQNSARGGVVMENTDINFPQAYVTLVTPLHIPAQPLPPEVPAQILYPTSDPDCNIPISWSASAGATGYDLDRSANSGGSWANILSNTSALYTVDSVGTPLTTYRYRVRAKNAIGDSGYRTGTDCNATLSTCYTGAKTADWILLGRPPCWCKSVNPRQCHGDADGKSVGKSNYWVSTGDLDVLVAAWSRPSYKTAPADPNRILEDQTITTTNGDVVRLVCADFDQTLLGKSAYRVSTPDLDILVANWSKINLPDANCP